MRMTVVDRAQLNRHMAALFAGAMFVVPAAGQVEPGTEAPDPPRQVDALSSEESIARYEQILQKRPFHAAALRELFKQLTDRAAIDGIIEAYEQRVEALPGDQAARIVLARIYLRAGRAESAAVTLDSVGQLTEAFAREATKLYVLRAQIAERGGDNEGAIAMIGEALDAASTISERMEFAESLADMHLRSGDREEASRVLIAQTEQFKGEYLYRKRIADSLAQRELLTDAVEEYRDILGLVERETDRRCEILRQMGRTLVRLDRHDEAIDVYTEAIGLLASGHWMQRELHEQIVGLYRAGGRFDDLIVYCREQIRSSPASTSTRILLSKVLEESGDDVGADAALRDATDLFPRDIVVSGRRIELLERAARLEEAGDEYERIIAQNPEDIELYVQFGEFLARHEQLEAARLQWQRVLGSELTDVSLAMRLGRLFEPYELLDDAVQCYERAIALAPDQAGAYTSLTRLWLSRGDKQSASEVLARMGEANPEDAGLHAERAQGLLALGDFDGSIDAIKAACELEPTNVRHHTMRSDLLIRSGRLEEALAVRRSTLDLISGSSSQAKAIQNLVSLHASAGRLEDLENQERATVERDPASRTSLLLLARIADHQRDFPQARDWLAALLELEPNHEEGLRQLARLQEAVGDVDMAVKRYRQLIAMNPVRSRPYYQAIVDLLLRHDDQAGAVRTLDDLLSSSAGNATVLTSVAEQLVRLEEFERGLNLYEQSLALQPTRHDTRLKYAQALEDAGQLEESLGEYRRTALQTVDRDSARTAMNKIHVVAGRLGVLDELIEELLESVQLNPGDNLVARAAAELLIREYEYSRAVELLNSVLLAHPRDVELHVARAALLRQLARPEEALESYRRVLRFPRVDRDYVLGEMGKACFESGRIEDARRYWTQINHKLYAGTLLRNNGQLESAITVLREGIRLKPDDFALHRHLVQTLQAAGMEEESLEAARRLLNLEPGNVTNIKNLASTFLERGDRGAAARIASRLFAADIKQPKPSSSQRSQWGSVYMMGYAGYYPSGPTRTNLDSAVQFYLENGLTAELEQTLTEQLALQPDNAVLRLTAEPLFSDVFGKPARAVEILKELETLEFPLEYQTWLGRSSQLDHLRLRQFMLIAMKPALRDARVVELEALESPSSQALVELAVIRQAQGLTDRAIELLELAVAGSPDDTLALSGLADILIRVERFAEAEPHVIRLSDRLAENRESMREEMIERIRREFVRTLPLQYQLRVTEELLAQIADKWTLGEGLALGGMGGIESMGYFRARMTLATIYAKTDRMEQAREIFLELSPSSDFDADNWTTLATVAQVHDQHDLAYRFYHRALAASKEMGKDPLLRRVFGGSVAGMWFGNEDDNIDSSFNKVVGAFAREDRLLELYDFLRETGQAGKAKRVAERYGLYDVLIDLYRNRVAGASEQFLSDTSDPLSDSLPYFVEVCKLAELYDQQGDWEQANRVFLSYLEDFPDELNLIVSLGEVAETTGDLGEAIEWERRVIECKRRLLTQSRAWSLREIYMPPQRPQILNDRVNESVWSRRWRASSSSMGFYYQQSSPLGVADSWMRIARLYLALENPIAAGDAMQRALGASIGARSNVTGEVLTLIRERRLIGQMLPVIRAMAVREHSNERIQLAFAESLEANDRPDVAAEVYRRMIRRGLSNVGILAQVREQLLLLDPAAEEAMGDSLESLKASYESDTTNANEGLRLAKAYYYSLQVDEAHGILDQILKIAPHLEGVHDLAIEIDTLTGDTEALLAALGEKIKRAKDERQRRAARERLVTELLKLDRVDDAINELKKLADPANPGSYDRVGMLLHYFGRHDEAIEQFELRSKSQRRGGYRWADDGESRIARALVLKGDFEGAIDKIMESLDAAAQEQTQYAGASAMYGMFGGGGSNVFDAFLPLLILEPEILDLLEKRILARRAANQSDMAATRLLMQFYRRTGRADQAESILDQVAGAGVADHELITQLIDRAIEKKDHDKAIELAKNFIKQQPKPQIPPGMPSEFAAQMALSSPRNAMLCKLGDIYWEKGDQDAAFEAYHQIVDEKIDESRLAYAAICLFRGRVDEARDIADDALSKQAVKSPSLLEFRALIAASQDQPDRLFELASEVVRLSDGIGNNMYFGSGRSIGTVQLAKIAVMTDSVDEFAQFMQDRIEQAPDQWSTYSQLIRVYSQVGRLDELLAVIEQASQRPSLRLEVLQARAGMLDPATPADERVLMYRELIQLYEQQQAGDRRRSRGSLADSYRDTVAKLLWREGRTDEAIKEWTERMDEKRASDHYQLAQSLLGQGARDEAERSLLRTVELSPQMTAAHMQLAALAHAKGDPEGTLTHLREAYLGEQERNLAYSWGGYGDDDPTERTIFATGLIDGQGLADMLGGMSELDAQRSQIMLAMLTGDWKRSVGLLETQLDASPYDPLIRKLHAECLGHLGEWERMLDAILAVKRIRETSIHDHREQLKLVLAGRQVREAAGGIRQAPQTPQASQAGLGYSSSYYGGYYGRGGADEETTQLATIYTRLGRIDDAKRLYVTGNLNGSVLPSVAQLLWRQDAKERALELMRLSVLTGGSNSEYAITQYANMLAEIGRTAEAVDLLIRAYNCVEAAQHDQGYFGRFWYGGSGYGTSGMEDSTESQYSQALHGVLVRTGGLDETLARLGASVAASPDDRRSLKLLISLQVQQRRWGDARESLELWRSVQADNPAVLRQVIGVNTQLGDWEAALTALEDLRAEEPDNGRQISLIAGFIRLMQSRSEDVATSIAPGLEDKGVQRSADWVPSAVLLATSDSIDTLSDWLGGWRSRGTLDEQGKGVLQAAMISQGAWQDAADLALENLWRDRQMLTTSHRWFGVFRRAVRGAMGDGVELEFSSGADRALMEFVRSGPEPGAELFHRVIDGDSESLDARRGLLLVAIADHDLDGAIAASKDLLGWLKNRRQQLWYAAPQPSPGDRVREYLAQMQSQGLDSQTVLGMSMGFGSLLQQALSVQEYGRSEPESVTYADLWIWHASQHASLVSLRRDPEVYRKFLDEQEELGLGFGREEWEQIRSMASMQPMQAAQIMQALQSGSFGRSLGGGASYSSGYYGYGRGFNTGTSYDIGAGLRQWTYTSGLLGHYLELAEEAGNRLPHDEWLRVAESHAALGDENASREWASRAAQIMLAKMIVTDSPMLSDAGGSWYWWGYGSGASEKIESIQRHLAHVRVGTDADEGIRWQASDALLKLSLGDPAIAERLLRSEAEVAEGWAETQTFKQLIRYHLARGEHRDVTDLIDRAESNILESSYLEDYIEACIGLGRFDRIDEILSDAQDRSMTLDDDVRILRAALLRVRGSHGEADSLERSIIDRCVDLKVSPVRVDEGFRRAFKIYQDGPGGDDGMYAGRRGWMQGDPSVLSTTLASVSELASAAGMAYQSPVGTDDLTLERLRLCYARCGLLDDAVRIIDMELAAATESARWDLTLERAKLFKEADKLDRAKEAIDPLLEARAREMRESTLGAERLESFLSYLIEWDLYADADRLYDLLMQAKSIEPMLDEDGMIEADLLFDLGRFDEADALLTRMQERGDFDYDSTELLYQAGIAADESGGDGALMLRRALWREPTHELADKARELLK